MAPERKCNLANCDANENVTKQDGFLTYILSLCTFLACHLQSSTGWTWIAMGNFSILFLELNPVIANLAWASVWTNRLLNGSTQLNVKSIYISFSHGIFLGVARVIANNPFMMQDLVRHASASNFSYNPGQK